MSFHGVGWTLYPSVVYRPTGLGREPVLTIAVAQDRTHLDKGYSPTDVLGWSPATDVLDVLYHVV